MLQDQKRTEVEPMRRMEREGGEENKKKRKGTGGM